MAESALRAASALGGAPVADAAGAPHDWFDAGAGPAAPRAVTAPAWALGGADEPHGFARLWKAFMSARVLLALAVLGLQISAHHLSQPLPGWIFGLSAAYIAVTVLQRGLAQPRGPGRSFDGQWLPIVGVDLLYVALLLSQQIAGIHYTPLMALPVLMAAILGTRALALGTAALAALLLLGDAVIGARASLWAGAADAAQAGLTGAGLLALAWLTNSLALRLAREQQLARRSRAEARMQSLVNNLVIETLADGVLVVNVDGVVHAANPAARVMLGSDQEVTPSVFGLADDPAWVQLADLARLTFAGEDVDGMEVTLHFEEREAVQLKVRTARTPSMRRGDARLCVMFLQDLREMQARLRTEKLAAMGRMSAAVAHEFRNPLAAISQANALLAEELGAPAQQRLSVMIRQNAQRLVNIVDDVLDVARSPSPDPDAELVQLNDETELFCQEWAAQHAVGARLQVQLQAFDLPVRFAPEHLRRLLVNLLDNAARYASRRDGAIVVSCGVVRHGPALLSVWSDGAPLDPAVERHLFEPFSSSESRSSGLGLFICRELCERHGAEIGYERRLREQDGRAVEGNAFQIRLRRAPGGHSSWGPGESAFS